MNRNALRLFQQRNYGEARTVLKQALDLCEAQGLATHPITARTHIHLGAVLIGGFEQRELGIKQFQKARQIQPDIALTTNIATPALEAAFQEATRGSAGSSSAAADGSPNGSSRRGATGRPTRRATDDEGGGDAGEGDVVARRSGRDSTDEGDEDDDDDDGDDRQRRQGRFFLGLMVGSGVGWAGGSGDLRSNTPVESPGFALTPIGHLAPEVGYWVRPTVRISIEGRFQRIAGSTDIMEGGRTYRAANHAEAGFAKVTWLLGRGGKLHPFVSAAIGGGQIRHVVTFNAFRNCGPAGTSTCVDTVSAGPLLAGAGAGLMLDIGKRLALVLAINTQVGAPRFTFNVDGNLGLAFQL